MDLTSARVLDTLPPFEVTDDDTIDEDVQPMPLKRRITALKSFFCLFFLATIVCCQTVTYCLAHDPGGLTAEAVRVEAEPTLDGILDEEVWLQAVPVSQFRQRNPEEGTLASERTEVRIVYSSQAIYFGVTCYDSEPDQIIATQRGRDAEMGSDDNFAIILDTFHSHRNSFLFEMNPLGARFDSWITDEGLRMSPEWDERWEVSISIDEAGWVAEVRIPFTALRMPSQETQEWGIDFRRNIRRKNEEVVWSNYRRDFQFEQVSQAGHLTGLEQISSGFSFRIKPFGVLGLRRVTLDSGGSSTHNNSDIGLEDFKYRLSPNLTLDLTLRPDFAETEVDQQRANLTRFPLFFPEKREFFLEDAGVFDFGPGGARPELKLFHSRRVGLTEEREEVPIPFGGRLTGSAGGFELGFLDVQTESSELEPWRNYAIGRVKRNVFSRSYVGAMATNLETEQSDDYNRTAGFDSILVFFDHLTAVSFVARSWSPGVSEDSWATRPLKLTWESDLITANAEHMIIQRNFEAEMGFVPRSDMKQTIGDLTIQPRPDSEWIRSFTLGSNLTYITNQAGDLETRDQNLLLGTEWESGDRLRVNLGRNLERITEPFLLRDQLLIFPGTYRNNRVNVRFRTFPGRRISNFFGVGWEDFWGGDRFSIEMSPNLILSDQVTVEIDYNFDEISLPQGQLTSHVINTIVRYNLTNSWLTSTTAQYDSSEELFNLNFRLNYIYRPGDDVFFVFNRTRTNLSTDWSVALKVTRSFDF